MQNLINQKILKQFRAMKMESVDVKGVDTKYRGTNDENILQHCLQERNDQKIDEVIGIIEKDPSQYRQFINHQDKDGYTPLMYAILHQPQKLENISSLKPELELVDNMGYNICLLYTSPSPRDRG